MADEPGSQRPLLRVVRGTPDDVELAALTAVVAGITASAGQGSGSTDRSPWSEPRTLLRRPLSHGPGAWRRSALPS